MQKRGQFFLIAALIIISLIIGFQKVYTSVYVEDTDSQIYDLSREIDFEGKQVVQHGVFFSVSESDLDKQVQDLTSLYASTHPDSEFLFVYGDQTSLTALSYELKESTFGISTGGVAPEISVKRTISQTVRSKNIDSSDEVKVKINDKTEYDFNLKKGNNFFLILSRERNEEKTIVGNQ